MADYKRMIRTFEKDIGEDGETKHATQVLCVFTPIEVDVERREHIRTIKRFPGSHFYFNLTV